jgi:hypothetical protein
VGPRGALRTSSVLKAFCLAMAPTVRRCALGRGSIPPQEAWVGVGPRDRRWVGGGNPRNGEFRARDACCLGNVGGMAGRVESGWAGGIPVAGWWGMAGWMWVFPVLTAIVITT